MWEVHPEKCFSLLFQVFPFVRLAARGFVFQSNQNQNDSEPKKASLFSGQLVRAQLFFFPDHESRLSCCSRWLQFSKF